MRSLKRTTKIKPSHKPQPHMHPLATRTIKRSITNKTSRALKKSGTLAAGIGLGAGLAHHNSSASYPRSAKDMQRREMQSGASTEEPANHFCFNPMNDFPLDRKVLITENVPVPGEEGLYEQRDTIHGTGGAITLAFDAKPWCPSDSPQPTWAQSQITGDGSWSPERPLRLAVSSTGLSKNLVSHVRVDDHPYIFWNRFPLPNFAIKGEDVGGLTGEDAVAVGHCGVEGSDTRHEYVPINKQSSHLIDKLFASIDLEDKIERERYKSKNQMHPKDRQLQGVQLFNDLTEPLSDRASLPTLLINDTNTERIEFRKSYIQQNPGLVSQLLTDDQLTQIRSQLHDSRYDRLFLNTALPLPVVTPVHSHDQKLQNQYGDEDMDFANLTTNEVFGKMGKDEPLMASAVLGVSDGVGGMFAYGTRNNTKQMSHLLMRSVRHNLTNDPKTSARDHLGQAFTSLLRHNEIDMGACTAAIGVVRPADPEEPDDEFDDGRRLSLSVANLGDSTILAFRPKHSHDFGTVTYVPLGMSWPQHHNSGMGQRLPPLQMTIWGYPNRPKLTINPDATNDRSTTLSTSHFSTPTTQPNSGPSGGANFFTSKVDYLKIWAGKKQLSDLFDHVSPTQDQMRAINNFAEAPADVPWMAQSLENVTLRRGDVVCVMSDGIMDNLAANGLLTPAELWEAVVSYVHPAVRAQHPATRNVRPFRQVTGKPLDHLSGAILSKFNKTPITDVLAMTDEILSKIADPKIPPYEPEGASKPYVSLRHASSHEVALILNERESPPQLVQQRIAPPAQLSDHENELLYKYNYVSTEGVRYHSTMTGDAEGVVAGTLSSAMSGVLVRFSQHGAKIDDMSVVVAVVY